MRHDDRVEPTQEGQRVEQDRQAARRVDAGAVAIALDETVTRDDSIFEKEQVSEIKVLTAKRDLTIGEQIKAEDLQWSVWPELGVVEGEREAAQRRACVAADGGGEDGRVEPAAEVRAHGHVGARYLASQYVVAQYGGQQGVTEQTAGRLPIKGEGQGRALGFGQAFEQGHQCFPTSTRSRP